MEHFVLTAGCSIGCQETSEDVGRGRAHGAQDDVLEACELFRQTPFSEMLQSFMAARENHKLISVAEHLAVLPWCVETKHGTWAMKAFTARR